MTEEPENIVLVYLRRLDAKMDRLDGKIGELTLRVNEVHTATLAVRRD